MIVKVEKLTARWRMRYPCMRFSCGSPVSHMVKYRDGATVYYCTACMEEAAEAYGYTL